jgi:hypothetical protein
VKASELRVCDLCGQGLMKSGLPLFYKLTIERMAVDMRAVTERHALEMLVGSGTLAEVFAPTADIASPIHEANTLLVCEPCSTRMEHDCVARLNETAIENAEKRAAKVPA